jgi:hypothetical protein
MTNVKDNVQISDNIGVVASSSSKQLSSIRTLSLPFFILNILLIMSVMFMLLRGKFQICQILLLPTDSIILDHTVLYLRRFT